MTDTTIKLDDGIERVLKYSIASCKRLKGKFGASIMTPGTLGTLDEDKLSELLYEGLRDTKGKPPEDLPTQADLDALVDFRTFPAMVTAIGNALNESTVPKNVESAQLANPPAETPAETETKPN